MLGKKDETVEGYKLKYRFESRSGYNFWVECFSSKGSEHTICGNSLHEIKERMVKYLVDRQRPAVDAPEDEFISTEDLKIMWVERELK